MSFVTSDVGQYVFIVKFIHRIQIEQYDKMPIYSDPKKFEVRWKIDFA